jgi:hypothetical protein
MRIRSPASIAGRVHPRHQERIGDILEFSLEKESGAFDVDDPSIEKNLPDDRGESEGGGQAGGLFRRRGHAPNRLSHVVRTLTHRPTRLKQTTGVR